MYVNSDIQKDKIINITKLEAKDTYYDYKVTDKNLENLISYLSCKSLFHIGLNDYKYYVLFKIRRTLLHLMR